MLNNRLHTKNAHNARTSALSAALFFFNAFKTMSTSASDDVTSVNTRAKWEELTPSGALAMPCAIYTTCTHKSMYWVWRAKTSPWIFKGAKNVVAQL